MELGTRPRLSPCLALYSVEALILRVQGMFLEKELECGLQKRQAERLRPLSTPLFVMSTTDPTPVACLTDRLLFSP